MATNLDLDEKLVEAVRRLSGHRTKKAAVTEALEEYVRRRKQLKFKELFGTIDFDPDFDYKKFRRR
jgi:Arc/MetJ family transcription regulator